MEVLFLTWFLVFVRAGAMLAVFPIFSAAAMPIRLRLAVAGFLALLTMPGVALPPELASGDMIGAVGLVAQEVCYGLLLGGVVRLVLFSVGLAGHYIGTELGLQLSSLIARAKLLLHVVATVIGLSTRGTDRSHNWFMGLSEKTMPRSYHAQAKG
jgi:flagellar biosynthetic protein FliR